MWTDDRPAPRIGITTRVTHAVGYLEPRDALAQDWYAFLQWAMPEASWLLIPNLGLGAVDYFRNWDLDGLILSGGNDIGEEPTRDQTESLLLDHCEDHAIPALGVCRGLQFIVTENAGVLRRCNAKEHVNSRHPVVLSEGFPIQSQQGRIIEVNSFHQFGVQIVDLPPSINVLATTIDQQWAECINVSGTQTFGIMWHPERDGSDRSLDRDLIRWVFKQEIQAENIKKET